MNAQERERRITLARAKAAAAAEAKAAERWRLAADLYATAAAIAEPIDDALWRDWCLRRATVLVILGNAKEQPGAYREAIGVVTDRLLPHTPRAAAREAWAGLQSFLAVSFRRLGECARDPEDFRRAISAQRLSLEECSAEEDPGSFRRGMHDLAGMLMSLWQLDGDFTHLDAAIDAYRAALAVRREAEDGLSRGTLLQALALAHLRAAQAGHRERLRDALAAVTGALLDAAEEDGPADLDDPLRLLMEIVAHLTSLGHSDQTLGDFAELCAFLDLALSARAGPVLAADGRFMSFLDGTAGLRKSLDLGPPVLPGAGADGPCADGPCADGPCADGASGPPGPGAADAGGPRPRPPGITDVVHGEQIAIAAKLAARAMAARERKDLAEAALFHGAAAAAAAPVDTDLRQTYLTERAIDLYDWGCVDQADPPLLEALHVYRTQLLPLCPPEVRPADWSAIMRGIGNILRRFGRNQFSTQILGEAVGAFRSALDVIAPDTDPAAWADAQREMGDAYRLVGDIDHGCDDEALAAYSAALEGHERLGLAFEAAATRMGMGLLFYRQAARARSPDLARKAVAAFSAAYQTFARDQSPRTLDDTRMHLDRARALLADLEG